MYSFLTESEFSFFNVNLHPCRFLKCLLMILVLLQPKLCSCIYRETNSVWGKSTCTSDWKLGCSDFTKLLGSKRNLKYLQKYLWIQTIEGKYFFYKNTDRNWLSKKWLKNYLCIVFTLFYFSQFSIGIEVSQVQLVQLRNNMICYTAFWTINCTMKSIA